MSHTSVQQQYVLDMSEPGNKGMGRLYEGGPRTITRLSPGTLDQERDSKDLGPNVLNGTT